MSNNFCTKLYKNLIYSGGIQLFNAQVMQIRHINQGLYLQFI